MLWLFVGAGSLDALKRVGGCRLSLELAHEERSLVAALCRDDSERLEAGASWLVTSGYDEQKARGNAPRAVGAARPAFCRGWKPDPVQGVAGCVHVAELAREEGFIARKASDGEPFFVAALLTGNNDWGQTESLVALSEEEQKQILHFVQDDTR